MKVKIFWIGKTKEPAIQALTDEYAKRIRHYLPMETQELRSEKALLASTGKERSRPFLVLLDARGKQMSSEELAAFLRERQELGTQTLTFTVGPADGWSADVWQRLAPSPSASMPVLVWSLGKITMAHEIARVVMLEQIYRALTILAGHPYHTGH